jgi:2-iminobutanoate/2-iminopropanoate deaminase
VTVCFSFLDPLFLSMASTSTSRSTVTTPLAPAAIGPYSQGILVGDRLYVSGQIALDPETGSLVDGDVATETERVLENVGAILKAASMSFENVVRCEVYMADMDDYAQINEVYGRYFNEQPPARQALEVAELPRGARVEISCIAVR